METNSFEARTIDIARWLKQRQEKGESTLLFLGARAGGLFRSKHFYATAQYFSPRDFKYMDRLEQFDECYRVICQAALTTADIENILITSLQGLKVSEADMALADLVQKGFFEVIISTNIDNLLTNAFQLADMKEGSDFHVYVPYILSEPTSAPTLLKAFGDLNSGEYNLFKQNFSLETHEKLKRYLTDHLSTHVLMLGYDQFWDRAIDKVLPRHGEKVWYVNEEAAPESLEQILYNRQGGYIQRGEGNYEQFIRTLHWYLEDEKPLTSSSLPPIIPTKTPYIASATHAPTVSAHTDTSTDFLNQKDKRNLIFIGHSKTDSRYFSMLNNHLAIPETKLLKAWDETKITPGSVWKQEMQAALDNTSIALLLVSPDFLASEYIATNILPPLLMAAQEEGAVIIPIILKHCIFEESALRQFQPFNLPSDPLEGKRPNERNKVWAELVRYITTLGREIDHD